MTNPDHPDAGAAWRKLATPGASEVLSKWQESVSDSSVRATMITPTSGKKVRIVAVQIALYGESTIWVETYFGTAASLEADPTKGIARTMLDGMYYPNHVVVWPDGGGGVGDVDEVVSLRTGGNVSNAVSCLIHYREE